MSEKKCGEKTVEDVYKDEDIRFEYELENGIYGIPSNVWIDEINEICDLYSIRVVVGMGKKTYEWMKVPNFDKAKQKVVCSLARLITHPSLHNAQYVCYEKGNFLCKDARFEVLDYCMEYGIFKFECVFEDIAFCGSVGVVHITPEYPFGNLVGDSCQFCEYWPCGNCWQEGNIRANNSWEAGDCIGVEVDMQKRTIHFFVNGVLQPFSMSDIPSPLKIYCVQMDLREHSVVRLISFKKLELPSVNPSTPVAPIPVADWRTEKSLVMKWNYE
jgi:hypothetical protein